MKAWKTILFLTAAAFAAACGGTDRSLVRIGRFVESAPDSALTALERIDPAALRGERNRAEYDYLYADAFYRTYFFLDTAAEENLLSACNWFDAHGPALSAIKSWELLSSVRTASERYSSGIVCQMKARAAARKIDLSRMRNAALLLLIVAVLATLILYFYARKVQAEKLLLEERDENERLMTIAEDLQNRLARDARQKKGGRIAGIDMLDRLCEQFYVYEGTANLQPKILKEVRSIVDGLRSDPKTWKALEASLDESRDGLMRDLRASFPKWKEEEFLLYSFVASGFSSTTIAALLEKDKPYVYNRIYRLKGRISSSGDPKAEKYLAELER